MAEAQLWPMMIRGIGQSLSNLHVNLIKMFCFKYTPVVRRVFQVWGDATGQRWAKMPLRESFVLIFFFFSLVKHFIWFNSFALFACLLLFFEFLILFSANKQTSKYPPTAV